MTPKQRRKQRQILKANERKVRRELLPMKPPKRKRRK